jgi:septal ring factor EnvC (AmiA/AmiB activator)
VRLATLFACGALALAALGGRADAQTAEQRLRQQQEELEAIRRERNELQRRLTELQGEAHDLSEEATNLRRQADATARLLQTLDTQLESITKDVDATSASLVRVEADVSTRRTALRKRLVDIYKRGPMFTTEALLSARTFGGSSAALPASSSRCTTARWCDKSKRCTTRSSGSALPS